MPANSLVDDFKAYADAFDAAATPDHGLATDRQLEKITIVRSKEQWSEISRPALDSVRVCGMMSVTLLENNQKNHKNPVKNLEMVVAGFPSGHVAAFHVPSLRARSKKGQSLSSILPKSFLQTLGRDAVASASVDMYDDLALYGENDVAIANPLSTTNVHKAMREKGQLTGLEDDPDGARSQMESVLGFSLYPRDDDERPNWWEKETELYSWTRLTDKRTLTFLMTVALAPLALLNRAVIFFSATCLRPGQLELANRRDMVFAALYYYKIDEVRSTNEEELLMGTNPNFVDPYSRDRLQSAGEYRRQDAAQEETAQVRAEGNQRGGAVATSAPDLLDTLALDPSASQRGLSSVASSSTDHESDDDVFVTRARSNQQAVVLRSPTNVAVDEPIIIKKKGKSFRAIVDDTSDEEERSAKKLKVAKKHNSRDAAILGARWRNRCEFCASGDHAMFTDNQLTCPFRSMQIQLQTSGFSSAPFCSYLMCPSNLTHSTERCEELHSICLTCHFKGHGSTSRPCRMSEPTWPNLYRVAFERAANDGLHTANRHEKSVFGFYPVDPRVSKDFNYEASGKKYKDLAAMKVETAAALVRKVALKTLKKE